MRQLVVSGDLTDAFVAGGQESNGDEGEDQGEGPGDAPLAEDDAEILR